MQIFIMRHGQASIEIQQDAKRPLTEQGKLESTLMASWMMKMEYIPETVWVSPYIRAQQTCQRLVDKMNLDVLPKTLDVITPSGNAVDVRDLIDGELAVNPCQQLLIVSHMPFVSYLVAELTQQQKSPIFQTAGVCEIAYDIKSSMGEMVRMVAPIDLC